MLNITFGENVISNQASFVKHFLITSIENDPNHLRLNLHLENPTMILGSVSDEVNLKIDDNISDLVIIDQPAELTSILIEEKDEETVIHRYEFKISKI